MIIHNISDPFNPSSDDFPIDGKYGFLLNVHGHLLKVSYKSDPYKTVTREIESTSKSPVRSRFVHLEFFGKTASPTGYRSHYEYIEILSDDVYTYVVEVAIFLYERLKRQHPDILKPKQMSLF